MVITFVGFVGLAAEDLSLPRNTTLSADSAFFLAISVGLRRTLGKGMSKSNKSSTLEAVLRHGQGDHAVGKEAEVQAGEDP